jgi:2-keto-3-deoxy-L-rhamnonate aldolase RhmA
MGPVRPSLYGRRTPQEVVAASADEVFLAVQIETVEALDVVEEIATVPGIDSLFVGPTDLSSSMGLLGQFDHPDVVAGVRRIVAAAKANGLSVGAGVGTSSLAAALIGHGVQWIQLSGSDAYLWQRFEQLDAEVRTALTDTR